MCKTLEEALELVKKQIASKCKVQPGWTVDVYMWPALTDPYVGIRVAEVSISTTNAGCSWMQSDLPRGLAVCAQVERVLLEYTTDGSDIDMELDRLDLLLTEA